MGRQRDIRRNTVWLARRRPSTVLLLALSLLLMRTGQAVAQENNIQPALPTVLEGEPPLHGVGDEELATIYGKGYQPSVSYREERLAVILWDEGKRKLPSKGAMSAVRDYRIDIHRSTAKQPR